ncbi:MAG: hypothetical protein V4508_00885 [Pseudomonadota bacterium]
MVKLLKVAEIRKSVAFFCSASMTTGAVMFSKRRAVLLEVYEWAGIFAVVECGIVYCLVHSKYSCIPFSLGG